MNHRRTHLLISSLLVVALCACEARGEDSVERAEYERANARAATVSSGAAQSLSKEPAQPVEVASLVDTYAWLDAFDPTMEVVPLDERFSAPAGFKRVEVEDGSFGAFLRHLPVRTDRTTVLSYAKKRLSSPSAAVVALDVGERNLQQCADTAIRLHAEYLWSAEKRDRLAYHFTSGDETRWRDWQKGERYKIAGSKVKRVQRSGVSNTHASFRSWLDTVFMYAGTRSLRFDSNAVDGAIAPGDFFVAPGSPGHAVVVLDVAKSDEGKRVALLGQGFMPAQELHVLRGRGSRVINNVWFVLPDAGEQLDTPSWRPFSREQARRFSEE